MEQLSGRPENEEPKTYDGLTDEPSTEVYNPSRFEIHYREARIAFERDEYRKSAQLATSLLKNILIDIIDRNYRMLAKSKEFTTRLATPEGKDLQDIPLRDLCALFDDTDINIFHLAKDKYEEYSPLLKSYNYENLAELAEYCQSKGDGSEVKLGVQQLLTSINALLLAHQMDMRITPYHLLANFSHMTDEIKRIRDSHTKLTTVQSKLSYLEEKSEPTVAKRSFEWIKLRGMLINQSDGTRNIAFKVETFVNILSTIYNGIVNQLTPISTEEDIRKLTKTIIFEAGYQSGSQFGWTMHEIFQKENKSLTLGEKVTKWCAFDSDVGFGMLSLVGGIKKEEKEKSGHHFFDLSFEIKLSDNFVVYKRESNQNNLCSFIAGYIQGVLEKITGQPLSIWHTPDRCEQFIAGQDHCIFKIATNEQELITNLSDAKTKYSDRIKPLRGIGEGAG